MRICHVITRMIIGGAQENTLYTIQGHLEKGHEVTLVTGPTTGPEGKLLQTFCPKGMEIVEIPELIRSLSPLKDWRAYRKLQKFFEEKHFDVVHTHASKAGIVGRVAARKAGVPVVVHTVHGQAFHPYQSSLKNKIYIAAERFAAKYCDRIYAVAQAMIDQCVAAGVAPREKYQVVYSGMDLQSFVNAKRSPELRAKLGIPEDAPVVGMLARLFELKGHDCMIAAAPKIVAEIPNVRFLFIGDGILREQFQAEIARLGLTEHFVFAGLIPPEQVPAYLAQVDILAHLSLREGLPRACVQALASGKAVVAYPLDGTPEVVLDGETGLLGEPENVDQVAANVLRLLQDNDLRERLGRRGQQFVLERFDWRKMADILEESYLECLRRKGK
ncbi:MAG: glycosyltransferase family 4 protein [Victivallales bacterium]|nr:glycosyltransferase family 4 protein [Victivallales bacterium]